MKKVSHRESHYREKKTVIGTYVCELRARDGTRAYGRGAREQSHVESESMSVEVSNVQVFFQDEHEENNSEARRIR